MRGISNSQLSMVLARTDKAHPDPGSNCCVFERVTWHKALSTLCYMAQSTFNFEASNQPDSATQLRNNRDRYNTQHQNIEDLAVYHTFVYSITTP